eukprot:TRINITY_DN1619_c0_g1_i1.p1 TRINITY_DN1619_c0_g1~~TRINITY_DN1619_c0_g1_i1.p1  ORF type:complete len:278 (-),score=7.21 TRINITY_DN1619_c0_g1_i1:152-985(-)
MRSVAVPASRLTLDLNDQYLLARPASPMGPADEVGWSTWDGPMGSTHAAPEIVEHDGANAYNSELNPDLSPCGPLGSDGLPFTGTVADVWPTSFPPSVATCTTSGVFTPEPPGLHLPDVSTLSPLLPEPFPGSHVGSSQGESCTEGGGALLGVAVGRVGVGGEAPAAAAPRPVDDAFVHKSTLARHFHVPRKEAAAAMGICVTILKRRCRSVGITAWPYRKMNMVEKRIRLRQRMLEDRSTELDDVGAAALKAEIAELRSRKDLLRRYPNTPSSELV